MRRLGVLLLLATFATTARATCGDGLLDPGEACDPGPDVAGDCCAADCQLEAAATVCRPQATACDVAESCDGVGDICPADDGIADGSACGGVPGTCDSGVCLTPLVITRARVKGHSVTRPDNGSIFAKGTFTVTPPLDPFGIGTGVSARVTDGLALDRSLAWTALQCVTFPNGGIRCINAERKKIRLDPTRIGPPLYAFTLRAKNLTTEGPFQAPVTIRITHSHAVDRVGQIATCSTTNSGALDCRP